MAERTAQQIVSELTLEEKCLLLIGGEPFATRAMPEHGIPRVVFSDGTHGLRHQADDGNHMGLGASEAATSFPAPVTLAQTWDLELAERMGAAMGAEAAAAGVGCLLAPALNTMRSPLCGRNFEYFSEDPMVSGLFAAAVTRGIQSRGISACPKHFAVNSQETRRMSSDSIVDERALRETYLSAFERCVKEAKPRAIMSSYNLVNGTHASENAYLLKDILRDEWGFDGMVVTDWGGGHDEAAAAAAGGSLEMPPGDISVVRNLVDAVREGRVSEEDIDARAREVVDFALACDAAVQKAPTSYDTDEHDALAQQVAEEGIVMLKNAGRLRSTTGEKVLPMSHGARVALIGDFATKPHAQGAGSSRVEPRHQDNLLDEIKNCPDLELVGFARGYRRRGGNDDILLREALDLVKRADYTILCLGLDEYQEAEARDRENMLLHENQLILLRALSRVTRNVVVLLQAGSPVQTDWLSGVGGALLLGMGGQAGAAAAVRVLTGRACPCGRLTQTWPREERDTPSQVRFPELKRTSEHRESVFVGYRYHQTSGTPDAFPFGYGLSYASFDYHRLRVYRADDGRPTHVDFRVANESDIRATEVCQVYVARIARTVFAPEQQLAGFARITLEPGEVREVVVDIDPRSYSYYNVKTAEWEMEPGAVEVRVGASSDDIRLRGDAFLKVDPAPNPYEGLGLMHYESGLAAYVPDDEFQRMLGREVHVQRTPIDEDMLVRDLIYTRSPLLWLVWCGVTFANYIDRTVLHGKMDNIAFIRDMPLRGLPRFVPGWSDEMVQAIVAEARGYWIIGLVRLLASWRRNVRANREFRERLGL